LPAVNECGASAPTTDVNFTVTPSNGARLVGTWAGTVSNFFHSFPIPPITSFVLTLNTEPAGVGLPLSGRWNDDQGCISTAIYGGADVFPSISIEHLACNDGDFIMTVLSNTGSVAEGKCNAGPNCTFRMTRR
jgi:hypothetical protein